MPTLSAARLRQLVFAYLVAVGLVTALFGFRSARLVHPWIVAEWLINYSGGFVRRGLPGEVLLGAARGLHLPLVPVAFAAMLAAYGGFYAAVYGLTRNVRWSPPLLAMLFSPATLAFTVLDPPSSMRKEALLFVVLGGLALLLREREAGLISSPARSWTAGVALAFAVPALVLSHEALLCYLPYLFVPLLVALPWRTAALLSVGPVLLGALAAVAVAKHPGDAQQAAQICRSVGAVYTPQRLGSPCSGAIAYLARDRAEASAETHRAIRFYNYGTRYPLPALLSLLPAALVLGRRLRTGQETRSTLILVIAAGVAILCSLPLFPLARDWGRWIHIHAVCLLLLCLFLERGSERAREDKPHLVFGSPARRRAAGIALLLYATCWTLPAVGIFPGRYGYVDLLRYLHGYSVHPHLNSTPQTLDETH